MTNSASASGSVHFLFITAAIPTFVDWLGWLVVSGPERFAFGGLIGGLFASYRFANWVQRWIWISLSGLFDGSSLFSDCRSAFANWRTFLHRRSSLCTFATNFALRWPWFGSSVTNFSLRWSLLGNSTT